MSAREVELRLGLDLQLPESYIPEPALRLAFYKRLAACPDDDALTALVDEARDRYGPPPPQLAALVEAQSLRVAARRAGIAAVARRAGAWNVRLDPTVAPPTDLARALERWTGARVAPSGEITLPGGSLGDVRRFVGGLAAA